MSDDTENDPQTRDANEQAEGEVIEEPGCETNGEPASNVTDITSRMQAPRAAPSPTSWMVYLSDAGKVLNTRTMRRMSSDAAMNVIKGHGNRNSRASIPSLIRDGQLTVADDALCMPLMDPGLFSFYEGRYFNTFQHSIVAQPRKDWADFPLAKAWQAQLEFMFPVGTHDHERAILSWFLAHNILHPGLKIRWAPLLVGPQGDGKTTVLEGVSRVLGRPNCHSLGEDELFSNFTAWPGMYPYVVIEELLMPGKRFNLYEKMKPFITNDRVTNVTKGESGRTVHNITNLVACSNHVNAVPVTAGDRRWAILFTALNAMSEAEAAEILKGELSRFSNLHRLLALPEAGAVLAGWATSINLEQFSPNDRAPWTDAKTEAVNASRSATRQQMDALCEDGTYYGVTPHLVHTGALALHLNNKHGANLNAETARNMLSEAGYAPVTDHTGKKSKRPRAKFEYRDRLGKEQSYNERAVVMYRKPNETVPDPTGLFLHFMNGSCSLGEYAKAAQTAWKEAAGKADPLGDIPF